MALDSPGVEVTIIDQSQYLPSASNSVPLILLATAQNKANAAGTGVAPATTAANANKLYQLTSQKDLSTLYGTPFFYKTTNGTPIQGYELNEYGLLATNSLLGATNRCYVLRADIDLGSLVGTLSRPVGDSDDGTYWLDTTNTKWGIYEFNSSTGKFTNKIPIVILDSQYISVNVPTQDIGVIGSYAVIPGNSAAEDGAYDNNSNTYFYKTIGNEWVRLGSPDWKKSIPCVVPTGSTSAIPTGSLTIQFDGGYTETIATTSGDSISDVVDAINAIGNGYLIATTSNLKLNIGYGKPGVDAYLTIGGTGTVLTALGITAGNYYAAETSYGPSSSMPLWTASQAHPHPTGSVWIKTSVTGAGMDLMVSKYSTSTASWTGLSVGTYTDLQYAILGLSSDGGKSIPTGTVVATYGNDPTQPVSNLTFWESINTGVTLITGSVTDFVTNPITIGLDLNISVSNTNGIYTSYSLTTTGTTGIDFVTDWLSLNITDTDATISSTGAIQLSHTKGGIIKLNSYENGQDNGLLAELGFTGTIVGKTFGDLVSYTNTLVTPISETGGSGSQFSVTNEGKYYTINSIVSPGTGFSLGDTIVLSGADLGGVVSINNLTLTVQAINGSGGVTTVSILSGTPRQLYNIYLSNWDYLTFIPNEGAPSQNPLNGTNWFYSTASQVDIMVNKNGGWYGYKNVNYDSTGQPAASGVNATDPLGPIISTTAPTTQTDGTALAYGDLWIDSGDLENYPSLYRWEMQDSLDQWIAIDITDQTSSNGVLFADARWGTSGSVDPVSDPLSSIVSLLTSNYLDLDAPDPTLYPQGMLLFNTRRSGYNVKRFTTNYFTGAKYPDGPLPTYSYTWVTASGLQTNGAAYMGRKAQRNMVVQALKAAINTNQTILEEDNYFNLIACPGYPELQPDMVVLNNNRSNTAFIIGDTPLRLPDDATSIANWANNTAGASQTGEDGLVTRDTYLGLFYPSGITTDLTGAQVVVPASHMMLRTFLRNDTLAYPWLAPAGTRRGTIDNATNIGYINADTGEFQTVKNRMSIRDVLYINEINPLAYFTGVGLLNYGNKTSFASTSALDRINVARLICYIRERLQVIARPFVFEPNVALTRSEIQGVVQSLMVDLVAKRGLYDYLVVCDESNNTPAVIDRNELNINVAIEPVKAAEFIFIPVRVMNTGEIAATK